MEMALNMGAFEALDQQEMMMVDGGGATTEIVKKIAKEVGIGVLVEVFTDLVKTGAKAIWEESKKTGNVLKNSDDQIGSINPICR